MAKIYNKNIQRVLELANEMTVLADKGDLNRTDKSCGILYGVLRDSAYKLKQLAEKERQLHIKKGIWDLRDEFYQI